MTSERPRETPIRGRYCRSGTVLLLFAPVQRRRGSRQARTLFEPLGISHDCRAFHSRNSGRIQITSVHVYASRSLGNRKKKKREEATCSFVRATLLHLTPRRDVPHSILSTRSFLFFFFSTTKRYFFQDTAKSSNAISVVMNLCRSTL